MCNYSGPLWVFNTSHSSHCTSPCIKNVAHNGCDWTCTWHAGCHGFTYQQDPPYRKAKADIRYDILRHEGWTWIYSALGRLAIAAIDYIQAAYYSIVLHTWLTLYIAAHCMYIAIYSHIQTLHRMITYISQMDLVIFFETCWLFMWLLFNFGICVIYISSTFPSLHLCTSQHLDICCPSCRWCLLAC